MLPPPTLSFTIPSTDNHVLQCRIYHPADLVPSTINEIPKWRKKAAIVAHPYAPLGGCYDDPVVDIVASTILKQGFIVGTFNFRGAGGRGRTTWTSKAEQNDYKSFIAFMAYYLHHIQPPVPPLSFPMFIKSDTELHDLSPIQSQATPIPRAINAQFLSPIGGKSSFSPVEKESKGEYNTKPRLLLAGYSYGAMITCCLPAMISSIITPYQTPLPGSAQAEIRLRASSLASQQNVLMKEHMESLLSQSRGRILRNNDHILHSPKHRAALRMGGEEDLRRASHDSCQPRRSFTMDAPERVRKSIDRIRSSRRRSGKSARRTDDDGSQVSPKKGSSSISSAEDITTHEAVVEKDAIEAIPMLENEFQIAYILISPLQGMINNLATMWSSHFGKGLDQISESDTKLTIDPTLAIFGDEDVFVSAKKLRCWVEKLSKQKPESRFRYREVTGAGHFWHDHQAIQVMRDEISDFIVTL